MGPLAIGCFQRSEGWLNREPSPFGIKLLNPWKSTSWDPFCPSDPFMYVRRLFISRFSNFHPTPSNMKRFFPSFASHLLSLPCIFHVFVTVQAGNPIVQVNFPSPILYSLCRKLGKWVKFLYVHKPSLHPFVVPIWKFFSVRSTFVNFLSCEGLVGKAISGHLNRISAESHSEHVSYRWLLTTREWSRNVLRPCWAFLKATLWQLIRLRCWAYWMRGGNFLIKERKGNKTRSKENFSLRLRSRVLFK